VVTRTRPPRTGSRRPHHGHHPLPHPALTPQEPHPCEVVPAGTGGTASHRAGLAGRL